MNLLRFFYLVVTLPTCRVDCVNPKNEVNSDRQSPYLTHRFASASVRFTRKMNGCELIACYDLERLLKENLTSCFIFQLEFINQAKSLDVFSGRCDLCKRIHLVIDSLSTLLVHLYKYIKWKCLNTNDFFRF